MDIISLQEEFSKKFKKYIFFINIDIRILTTSILGVENLELLPVFFHLLGYGSVVPRTHWGRVFCVLYAMIGIPSTFIVLAMSGRILAKYINHLCAALLDTIRTCVDPQYDGYER